MRTRRVAWRPRSDVLAVSAMISATIVAALAVVARLDDAGIACPRLVSFCFFGDLLGVPCPFCGSTRALIALSHGAVRDALALNPAASVAALLGIMSPFIALAPGADRATALARRLVRPAFLWPLVAAEWGYVLLRFTN